MNGISGINVLASVQNVKKNMVEKLAFNAQSVHLCLQKKENVHNIFCLFIFCQNKYIYIITNTARFLDTGRH